MQTFSRAWKRADPADAVRTAWGAEITSDEIRVVRLSCQFEHDERDNSEREIHVDDAACYPLPRGVVVGSDIVDSEALTNALADCLSQQAMRCEPFDHRYFKPHATHADTDSAYFGQINHVELALALCPSVVVHGRVAMAELMPGFTMQLPGPLLDEAAFDALEPWVFLHAQKITGVEPADLAIDWYRSFDQDDNVMIVAAAQRHYLDVRQRVVDGTGARLTALGDAAAAALGACRFLVARSLRAAVGGESGALYPSPVRGARFSSKATESPTFPITEEGAQFPRLDSSADALYPLELGRRVEEARRAYVSHAQAAAMQHDHARTHRFAALWIGERAWHAWAFDTMGSYLHAWPLPAHGDPAETLHILRQTKPSALSLVLVAGKCEALEPVGGLSELGRALGCPAIEFDVSACCTGPGASVLSLDANAAVAFGVALRELMR